MMVLPQILANLGETPVGYAVTAIAAGAMGCLLVFIHYAFTVERNAAAQNAVKSDAEKEAEKIKLTDILNVFKVNRPYLALCVHSICICFVQGIAQGASTYMYSDVLGNIGLVTVRQGIDYLGAIARSLLRLGFKRQVYISFHGPAHMTICPMVRDFYDETGVPILYIDSVMKIFSCAKDLGGLEALNDMFVGAYKVMGRLEDVPLVTGFSDPVPQSCAPFNDLFALGYQSAAVGE